MPKYYLLDENKNLVEGFDKEGFLALLQQAIEQGSLEGIDEESAVASKLRSVLNGTAHHIEFVTQAQYNQLVADGELVVNTYYFIIDDTTAEDLEEHIDNNDARVLSLENEVGGIKETTITEYDGGTASSENEAFQKAYDFFNSPTLNKDASLFIYKVSVQTGTYVTSNYKIIRANTDTARSMFVLQTDCNSRYGGSYHSYRYIVDYNENTFTKVNSADTTSFTHNSWQDWNTEGGLQLDHEGFYYFRWRTSSTGKTIDFGLIYITLSGEVNKNVAVWDKREEVVYVYVYTLKSIDGYCGLYANGEPYEQGYMQYKEIK